MRSLEDDGPVFKDWPWTSWLVQYDGEEHWFLDGRDAFYSAIYADATEVDMIQLGPIGTLLQYLKWERKA